MNHFSGIGNLTKDPELKKTNSNLSVCDFTIAINEGYGEKKTTEFVDCIVWKNLADNLCKYLHKGDKLAVEGRYHAENYETKNGEKRHKTQIVVTSLEFLTKKKDEPTYEESYENSSTIYTDDPEFQGDNLPFY